MVLLWLSIIFYAWQKKDLVQEHLQTKKLLKEGASCTGYIAKIHTAEIAHDKSIHVAYINCR